MCRNIVRPFISHTSTTIKTLNTGTCSVVTASEPSDLEIWTAMVSSLAKSQKLRKKTKMHHSHVQKREEKVVCYTRFVWCFSDESPFEYWDTLPETPEIIETTFNLYTRHNRLEGESLHYDNKSSLKVSQFNASNPVKIIIHGFGGSAANAWVGQMVEAMLEIADVNIIVVDWNKGARLPNYVQAAANSRLVGREIAELIRLVNYERGTVNEDYHLIGYSLGAHIAGFVGTEIKNLSRITGLDPAAPMFETYNPAVRLDPSDAQFVDVIHTNGESMVLGGLGVYESIGDVDFFPNGGKFQKGCSNVLVGALSDIFWGQWHSLCHHRRAIEYFIESMKPGCSFLSVACDDYDDFLRGNCFSCFDNTSCSNMGYFADELLPRGKMFLLTRADEPYCGNQYRVIVNNTQEQGKTWGRLEITLIDVQEYSETFISHKVMKKFKMT
ncbi:pancreatic lipase-related protein 2-like isoform X2 [Tachypleus tridentatus]|uniref:pancreatic lipase-related protein 2-like isoform X2 n=1 Tax=Tachypleus tridentatus TaxID=6853 RepID=UPI003FD58612